MSDCALDSCKFLAIEAKSCAQVKYYPPNITIKFVKKIDRTVLILCHFAFFEFRKNSTNSSHLMRFFFPFSLPICREADARMPLIRTLVRDLIYVGGRAFPSR